MLNEEFIVGIVSSPCPLCGEMIYVGHSECIHCGGNIAGYEEEQDKEWVKAFTEQLRVKLPV